MEKIVKASHSLVFIALLIPYYLLFDKGIFGYLVYYMISIPLAWMIFTNYLSTHDIKLHILLLLIVGTINKSIENNSLYMATSNLLFLLMLIIAVKILFLSLKKE